MRGNSAVGVIGSLLTAAGWLLLRYYVGVPFEVMLAGLVAVLFAFVIGWPIGWIVGHFVSRDSDVDTMPFKLIAGVNLVAWIVPVAGVALSTITLHFSKRSYATPTFYWLLAAVGGWGAIANAGIGGAHEMQMRQIRAKALEMGGVTDSGERSTARCAYAAREAWSNADYETYCR